MVKKNLGIYILLRITINYKNFFIASLRDQKIKTLFIFKDKERYLKNIFNTDCYVKENINKNLSKINIERCIN